MSRNLEDLDARFRPLAEQLLEECRRAGISLVVIDTRRTLAEHQRNLARGVSWIRHSLHLDGLAIDVCPETLLREKFWAPAAPEWQVAGEIGERLGMRWGGRWKQRDMAHFEYVAPGAGREKRRA